ncbi:MAG TPA: AlkA N-terminal domain-containing protein [Candidatus Angelobacter sp.]|jgi:DNA-3-methyladenine glycosylase II
MVHSFALPVQLPFDWESLLAFLRLRATPGVETVTASAYTRTISAGPEPHNLSVTFDPAISSLRIEFSGDARARSLIESRAQQIFKANVRTGPIEEFLARDAWLAPFILRQPGLRVPGGWSAFEIAVRAILGQQVSVPAATTLMGRLVRLSGTRVDESAWLFPTPEQVLNSTLAGMGVPASRLEAVKVLAAFFAENVDACLSQPDVKDRLLALKGIGKWTAGYILMRTGDSHDHWPEGDLVLRKALSKSKVLIAHERLEQTFNRWSPYRSFATIHIWKGYAGSKLSQARD